MPTEIAALRREMEEFRKDMGEIRRKTDERHQENGKRFDHIEAQLGLMNGMPATLIEIKKAIAEHAELDIRTLGILQLALDGNTAATNAVRDNVAALVALQVGRKVAQVATTFSKIVMTIGGVCAALVTLYGLYLFLTGRSPFPPALPPLH